MNRSRKLIFKLLPLALRNEKTCNLELGNCDWNEIYEEAKAQGIHTLLYPVLKELNTRGEINAEIMQRWQKAALTQSMYQLQLMKEVQKLLLKFHQEGIKTIALKGIVLRELYPYPELRTMGDADILVHREDLGRARDILLELGFYELEANPEHIEFINKNNIETEIHWSLIGEGRFRRDVKLEENAWDNAVETTVFDVPVLMLGKEENFLYTGLHMAKHMVTAGFGLRQLCDFALLYESIENAVDWGSYFERLEKYGAQKFFILLFLACEKLFSVRLPDCSVLKSRRNRKYAGLLIDEIFESGLYGYKSPTHTLGSFTLRKVKGGRPETGAGRSRYARQLLFPSTGGMNARYGYAAKYPVLLPAAWAHRLVVNIFAKKLPVKEKISFFKQYRKRSELLGWLDIR